MIRFQGKAALFRTPFGGSRLVALVATASLTLTLGACGSGSSGGAAPATSAVSGLAPLHARAMRFEERMQADHVPYGLVQDVTFDAAGAVVARSGPSRCLWTGVYAASQAMRHRQTGDPAALANMEKALRALHDIVAITGVPGVPCRGFDLPQFQRDGFDGTGPYAGLKFDKGNISRDQITGWFYGLAHAWPEIRDASLRADLAADARAICENLMANDLALKGDWGGVPTTFFNLNPDYAHQDQITPQTWATVDDFPLNVIARAVPYDPQLAAAIRNLKIPPIQAGEALRAVAFFTVAAEVTGDPRFAAYKRDLLYGPKDFARIIETYHTLSQDALHGENLAAVRTALDGIVQALVPVYAAYLQSSGQSATMQALLPALASGIGQWLTDQVVDVLAFLADPNNQAKATRLLDNLRAGAALLRLVGQTRLATSIEDFVTTWGPRLNQQGLIDLANSIRSYTGLNLNILALATALRTETDPATLDFYRRVLDRQWRYVALEQNPMVNLFHARYCPPGPNDHADARRALEFFPDGLRVVRVDNSSTPGLVVSPWPDRFGRVGNLATGPVFPIELRERHIYVWQSNPRTIVDGQDLPLHEVAPLAYLAPYWLAREFGALSAGD